MKHAADGDGSAARTNGTAGRQQAKRLIPLIILGLVMVLFFVFDLHRFVSFEALKTHRMQILGYYETHRLLTIGAFAVAYTAVVALSIPGAVWMTLLAGFLFGTVLASVIVVLAATVGSLVVFLAARYAFADYLYRKAGPFVRRMEDGFRRNAFSYLMFLRLVPLFPFWLVNLVPAFLNVGTGAFVVATILGIAPATVVFSSVGSGLGAVLDAGGRPDLGIIFEPHIMGPLLGLALLALVPVFLRKSREQRDEGERRGGGQGNRNG